VFLGEQRTTSVVGVHGWLYFAQEEAAGRLNYFGHMTTMDLGEKVCIFATIKIN
jgi:hypothetical protein